LRFVQTPLHLVWPSGHLHAPVTHFSPPLQEWPQAPQFVGSTCRLTQAPAQASLPVHVPVQLPDRQTWPVVHFIPQDPQLFGSKLVKTQAPPQAVGWPRLMTDAQPHVPAAQTCPDGQVRPHPPQLPGFVAVSTQAPPHDVVPPGHVAMQAAFEQT